MYENIGKKIKGLAGFLAAAGIILSIIIGIVQIVTAVKLSKYSSYGISTVQTATVWSGILTIILGSVASVVSTYVLYGFGQLVESAQNIEREIVQRPIQKVLSEEKPGNPTNTAQSASEPEWSCPKCLCINPLSAAACRNCGTPQRMGTLLQPSRSAVTDSDKWKCPRCGCMNSNCASKCDCGEIKPVE